MTKILQSELQEIIDIQIKEKQTNLDFYSVITINKVEFTDGLSFFVFKRDIKFEECIFSEGVILEGKIDVKITFLNCKIQRLSFIAPSITKELLILNSEIKENIFIAEASIEKITIELNSLCQQIIISPACSINSLSISSNNNATVTEVRLFPSSIKEKFYFNNLNCNKFILGDYPVGLTGELDIFNCKINNLVLERLRNDGILKITNCAALSLQNEKSVLSINQSNLGNTEFLQFDFSSYDEVNVISSFIGDCIFVNTKWDYKKINPIKDKETLNLLEQRRDAFKQIKHALSKQGDAVNEKVFYGAEMDTYNKTLKLNWANFSTKVILWLSKLTSNYGQSLLRPLIVLFTVNGFLLWCLLYLNKISDVGLVPFYESNCEGCLNGLGAFLSFCNPLHTVLLYKTNPVGGVLIIDILARMVSSFMIYNIIRATRRFIN